MKRQSAKALLSVALVAAMIAAGAAVHGCGGVDCTINNTVTATLNFYSRSGAAVAYTDTLTVTVVGAKGDSVILNRKKNASGFTFPLGYTHDCDTFVLHYTRDVCDSLFLWHDNHPYFISLDCGTAMFHTLTRAECTHTLLQEAVIVNPEINYDGQENIKLYFRVD
ncbi:MAG: hypothetical protein J5814_05130 [Bacteroidaceae bacterium]|nr:hypothetical protein [Bacteroidaceae bacterium]